MNEFYVFRSELLHFPNELATDNALVCSQQTELFRRDVDIKLNWISNCKQYSFVQMELISTGQTKEDHWYTKQQALYRRAMTLDNEIFSKL